MGKYYPSGLVNPFTISDHLNQYKPSLILNKKFFSWAAEREVKLGPLNKQHNKNTIFTIGNPEYESYIEVENLNPFNFENEWNKGPIDCFDNHPTCANQVYFLCPGGKPSGIGQMD